MDLSRVSSREYNLPSRRRNIYIREHVARSLGLGYASAVG
jgi:hypothetical protein